MTVHIPVYVLTFLLGCAVATVVLLIIGMYGARRDQERQEDMK